jgi:hypothetical protein
VPDEYEPPGYVPGINIDMESLPTTTLDPEAVKMGLVTTPHHVYELCFDRFFISVELT